MRLDEELLDLTSISVVAIVAIAAVVLIVFNLNPALERPESTSFLTGAATFDVVRREIAIQFPPSRLDFNHDGRLDHYDFSDHLLGQIDCYDCDLNDDGYIDAFDKESFDFMVRRLYDYDNDGTLGREDARILSDLMLGEGKFDQDHIYDQNGDGWLDRRDVTLYTSILYGYDNPVKR